MVVATLRPAASAPTLSTSEVGVPVSAAALTRETMLARLKYDLVNNEVKALRTKQARLRSRLDGFTSQEDLGAEKDEDAAKVAALEAEQREVERQSREHQHAEDARGRSKPSPLASRRPHLLARAIGRRTGK